MKIFAINIQVKFRLSAGDETQLPDLSKLKFIKPLLTSFYVRIYHQKYHHYYRG